MMIAEWIETALDTSKPQELRQAACFLLYRLYFAEIECVAVVNVNINNQWVNKQTVTYKITIGKKKYIVTLTVFPFCS